MMETIGPEVDRSGGARSINEEGSRILHMPLGLGAEAAVLADCYVRVGCTYLCPAESLLCIPQAFPANGKLSHHELFQGLRRRCVFFYSSTPSELRANLIKLSLLFFISIIFARKGRIKGSPSHPNSI